MSNTQKGIKALAIVLCIIIIATIISGIIKGFILSLIAPVRSGIYFVKLSIDSEVNTLALLRMKQIIPASELILPVRH